MDVPSFWGECNAAGTRAEYDRNAGQPAQFCASVAVLPRDNQDEADQGMVRIWFATLVAWLVQRLFADGEKPTFDSFIEASMAIVEKQQSSV